MEREDPLEKYERTHSGKSSDNTLKAVMIAMIVVAVALAIALAYILKTKNALVRDLNEEKMELAEQIQTLQADYEDLSSDYESINAQLDSSREEVAQLMEQVKKTEATNRAKIRQYQKELGTLRTIMRSYIVQIDSLNTLNHELTAQAAQAKKEAAQHKKRSQELQQEVNQLSSQVATGSIVKARGLHVDAFTDADKITDKSNRVARLLVSLTLVENELATRGPLRVYVCVTDPEGNLLSDGKGTSFNFEGNTIQATASREVDYEGKEIDLSVYVNNIASFPKGVYTIRAYTESSTMGSTELLLR